MTDTKSPSRFILENVDTLKTSPRDKGFTFDADRKWLTIKWGGYDYEIEMSRIKTPTQLLGWVSHLGEKEWLNCEPWKIARLVELVAREKGWNIHGL